MADASYGRGQVEWALWRSFARAQFSRSEVPQVFRTRIKRLLDIDREMDLSGAEVPPEADYAFAPPASAQSGEFAYAPIDAFCLAVGLDLLDAGFKQSEVVFLMRYLRPDLEAHFNTMLAPPSLIDRQRHRAKDYPKLPVYKERGRSYADGRLFVILQKIELTEIHPGLQSGRSLLPVILEPRFCAGITKLGEALHDLLPNRRRAVTVLELAGTAQAVQSFLKEAPVIRRGRPKS